MEDNCFKTKDCSDSLFMQTELNKHKTSKLPNIQIVTDATTTISTFYLTVTTHQVYQEYKYLRYHDDKTSDNDDKTSDNDVSDKLKPP